MNMTREEQLDAVVRHYGEWNNDFYDGVAFFLPEIKYVCYTDTAIDRHAFTREEVEARKAELQNKPSWDDAPEWAEHLAQDGRNGVWHWYESEPFVNSCDDEFDIHGGRWKKCPAGRVIGDWRDTLEWRPETDSMDADSDNSWNGEGLPPVGAEFEFSYNGEVWGQAIMLFNDGISCLVADKNDHSKRWHYKCEDEDLMYRHIKSDREKWIEMVEQKTGLYVARSTLEAIYDAGLGKMPE